MSSKNKRRDRFWKRMIIVALLFCSAGAGARLAFAQLELSGAVNRGDTALQDVQVDASVVYDKDIINILLVGCDKRETWQDTGRSDSTMIATVDLKHQQLKLVSLMRDMYVPIPGHDSNKFNAAYAFGGVELLYQTIAQNFNVKLDGYVEVNFKAFTQIVDKLGGVEIALTEKEANYLNTAYHGKLQVETGSQMLSGKEALAYCRIRQKEVDYEGDFGRTQRQRNVLNSIFDQFKGKSFGELKDILVMALKNVTTDLSDQQIFSLAVSVLGMEDTELKQLRIPLDQTYTDNRYDGVGAVLVPDLPANASALQKFILEDANLDETGSTEVITEGTTSEITQE